MQTSNIGGNHPKECLAYSKSKCSAEIPIKLEMQITNFSQDHFSYKEMVMHLWSFIFGCMALFWDILPCACM